MSEQNPQGGMDPMMDPELDQPLESSPGEAHFPASISMKDIPSIFSSYAPTPDVAVILAQIDELQGKVARAVQPVEDAARRRLKQEIQRLQRLLLDTSQGIAAIDNLSPRIDLGFLKLGMLQWPYGWLPRFAVFTQHSPPAPSTRPSSKHWDGSPALIGVSHCWDSSSR